ncbi:hypothetical protein DEM26_19185 [Thioclava sp. NG1]|uniref:hypothetical protein n=1 Tax=Thioclava sp. NG1 TaxID=2182426 RepID=UPI000D60C40D|nr:hypothetical protein [Thioclava sp. NG1]PWE48299.1 hypothetical protein DEM26_19185 [Thioclava sp. NG1]
MRRSQSKNGAKIRAEVLPEKFGCLPATVANIETGHRRIDVIEQVALADVFEVPARDFFEIALRNTTPEELFSNFSRAARPRCENWRVEGH